MENGHRLTLAPVLIQHAEEAAAAWRRGRIQRHAAAPRLAALARFDEQLAGHLDGLLVAGHDGRLHARALLQEASAASAFVNAFLALMNGDAETMSLVAGMALSKFPTFRGIRDAAAWASEPFGSVRLELNASSTSPVIRALRVIRASDAGDSDIVASGCSDPSPFVRSVSARVLRHTGNPGAGAVRPPSGLQALVAMLDDSDLSQQSEALQSLVLLGDRGRSLDLLSQAVADRTNVGASATRLALKALPQARANELVTALARCSDWRLLMRAVGAAGDPRYIDWVISCLDDPLRMRAAGEALSLITGLDLAWHDLDRSPPEKVQRGPNDDPDDENVDMDEDEGLPWPDPAKVQAWWSANSHRFQPGVRYFMGAPPSWKHCLQVLKDGYQRQRMAAAEYLCLLRPGTMLFNCEAPAWRQQRWLANMN